MLTETYTNYLANRAMGAGVGLIIVLAIGTYLAATDRTFRYALKATFLTILGR